MADVRDMILDELLDFLVDSGFYYGTGFNEYGIESDTRIDSCIEDFFIQRGVTEIQTDITEAFDSPGYECSVLSVAWVGPEGLRLETWLLERC